MAFDFLLQFPKIRMPAVVRIHPVRIGRK
jgi:hypothetical protein